MAYKLYNTAQGEFAVDWDICCQIIRSYHRADLQLKHARPKKEPQGWGLPQLSYVEVDWKTVTPQAQGNVMTDAFKLAAVGLFQQNGMDTLVRDLKRMQQETQRLNSQFSRLMQAANDASRRSMEESIARGQWYVDKLKLVRDLSGSFLIGACTVTGIGAVAAVGGAAVGTGLKTYGRYQDTHNDSSWKVELAQNVMSLIIPAKLATAGGQMVAKVVIATAGDSTKAYIEGEAVGTAVKVGLAGAAITGGGEVTKKVLKTLSDVAVPIVVKVAGDKAKKALQNDIKAAAASASLPDGARKPPTGAISRVTFETDLLLKLAIVDMSKGIGHSWW